MDGPGASRQLAEALRANTPGSGVDHVVVALPSFNLAGELLAHYAGRIPAMEHRYLNAQALVTRIDCDFVLVCSSRPPAEVFAYSRRLVAPELAERLDAHVHCIALDDPAPLPLARKLRDRPELLEALRTLIRGRPALVEPWNVTADELAVADAIGAVVNGTRPELRHLGFKSAGRRLFAEIGVPAPYGREGVRTRDEIVTAIGEIRTARAEASAVVLKLEDSGAGDGNTILRLVDDAGARVSDAELGARIDALPAWYLRDLTRMGGIVEERIDASPLRSPSVQIDLLPDGRARVVATHDQLLGGPNGQVFVGCRFPADPAYAPSLAERGLRIGDALSRRGALGRASIDFLAAPAETGWDLLALEINLRKGGTTHPFAALRTLVPGRYDVDAGSWIAELDGRPRAYRSTDNVQDAAWLGRAPSSVILAVRDAGLEFDPARGTGVVLHMLTCLAIDGRFGATAIGRSATEADDLFERLLGAVA